MSNRAYDADNLSPLDFLLAVMHDTHLPIELRIHAAEYAGPYCNAQPRPMPSESLVIRIQSEAHEPADVHVHPFWNLFEHRPNPFRLRPNELEAQDPAHGSTEISSEKKIRPGNLRTIITRPQAPN
jgi:hypothetical protein